MATEIEMQNADIEMLIGNREYFEAQPQIDLDTVHVPTGPEFLLRLVVEGDLERFQEEISNLQRYPRLDVRAGPGVYYDRTPLHLAAMHGKVEIVRCIFRRLLPNPGNILVQDVVNAQEVVNATDRFGYTPLHLAIRGDNAAALLEQREKIDACEAVRFGFYRHKRELPRKEVARILTTSSWVLPDKFIGATSDRDEYFLEIEGFTPLHLAAATGNTSMVKLLLRQSLCRGEYSACDPVNIRATTWEGESPLDIAKKKRHFDVVDLLECSDLDWLQSEREKTANSLNVVLVGAALVVAATFTTWLQPPLGVPNPIPDPVPASLRLQSRSSASFFVFVAIAFALSLVALVMGTFATIPFTRASLKFEVQYLRAVATRAACFLFAAICFLNVAFLVAGILVYDKIAFDKAYKLWGRIVILLVNALCTVYMSHFFGEFRRRK